jgi:hypothetical protein
MAESRAWTGARPCPERILAPFGARRNGLQPAPACARIADSPRFQAFIFGVIVANAIVLGLETYDAVDRTEGASPPKAAVERT